MSLVPVALLEALVSLAPLLSVAAPSRAEEVGFDAAFALVLLTPICELVALALGIAGSLQRRRKRTFALLGVACSVLVLAAFFARGFALPA